MILTCQRCEKKWDYRGQSVWYATCPRCKTTVKVPKKEKVKKENNDPPWVKEDLSNSIETDKGSDSDE